MTADGTAFVVVIYGIRDVAVFCRAVVFKAVMIVLRITFIIVNVKKMWLLFS